MRYAINIPNFGDFADPRLVAGLARDAEQAGWDGLFVWDHILHHKDVIREFADPWVLLTAAALATSRIRLGTMITPLARRRPSKLAREVATLDRLTGGRMILGAGLGAPVEDEFGSFGEPTDPRRLAVRLDEGLDVLNGLWSGVPFSYHGTEVTVDDVTFLPTPVQRPRVPVWVGGNWPAKPPMRRAARWDGAFPIPKRTGTNRPQPDAAMVAGVREFLTACREAGGKAGEPFDLTVAGTTPDSPAEAAEVTGPLAEAGATWWQECRWDDEQLGRAAPLLRRVQAGPPAIR